MGLIGEVRRSPVLFTSAVTLWLFWGQAFQGTKVAAGSWGFHGSRKEVILVCFRMPVVETEKRIVAEWT